MNCMPDTGASQSIVSADTARAANLCIQPTMTELQNTSNGVMTLLGEADVILCNDKHSACTVVVVASTSTTRPLSVGRIYISSVSSLHLSLKWQLLLSASRI